MEIALRRSKASLFAQNQSLVTPQTQYKTLPLSQKQADQVFF